jgi:phospholipid/cholesterol/gamma-HCH transport system permease protein
MSRAGQAATRMESSPPEVSLKAVDPHGEALYFDSGKQLWLKSSDHSVSSERPAKATLFLTGSWLQKNERPLFGKLPPPSGLMSLCLDCSGLAAWDSSALIYLRKLQRQCRAARIDCEITGMPDGMRRLLNLGDSGNPPDSVEIQPHASGFAQKVGIATWQLFESTVNILSFVGEFTRTLGKFFVGQARFQWRDLITQLASAGPSALAIISLIGFLMGLILAFIGAIPLQMFGAESYVASLIGIGILRLMAPVMVGVVMAGRTGAAFAAELGTMQTNEEIDAFRTLGIPPMEFLVLPRCLALTLMMPLLCIFADLLGMLGGLLVARFYLDITWLDYWQTLLRTTRMADMMVGLFSAFVFGILVSACGCYQGIFCGRNAAAVGRAATAAVVSSIVCIVLATATITIVTVVIRL